MAIKPGSETETLLVGVLAELERELGRKWTTADTLPFCPHCATPPLPGVIGGVLCMRPDGRASTPHAARLKAWRLARSN